MKLILFFALIGLALLPSCDNTNRRFYPPKLKIENPETGQYSSDGFYADSVKNVFKTRALSKAYMFEVHAYDFGIGLSGIKYSIDVGQGVLQDASGTAFTSNSIAKTDTVQTFLFAPSKSDVYRVSFRAYNHYGVEGDPVTLSLFVFDNLLPEAKLACSADPDPSRGPHAMILDASASYDRDKKYGGDIATYEFTITENGKTHKDRIYTPKRYVQFSDAGVYQASLTVYDNDGAASATFFIDIIAP